MSQSARSETTPDGPADALVLVANIHRDTMAAFEHIAFVAGPLESRTTLAIFVRQALEELASYWPEPQRDSDFDLALFDLRCQLLPHLRGDAKQIEVLRVAAQRIALHVVELAEREELIRALQQDLESKRQEIARVSTKHPLSPVFVGTVGTPSWPTLIYHGKDGAGNPILAVEPEEEPAGVAVAGGESDEEGAPDWGFLSPVWASVPQAWRELILEMESGDLAWRQLEHDKRLQIARHVLHCLPAKKMRDYDRFKPAWMPTAAALTNTFHIPWSNLVKMVSPWID